MKILRWLEQTADYSMVLDWPTFSMNSAGYDPATGLSLHPGLKTFEDCLNGTLENHKFFIKHRKPGATKFLNILQGVNVKEGDVWWDAVKDLPFEGWAFGGIQGHNFAINLRRLIIMRDGGYLEDRDWMHYLGNGKIRAVCALTTVQRNLRKYVNPRITLSCDAASPFLMSANGQAYHDYTISHNRLNFKSGSIMDDKGLKGSPMTLNTWLAEQNQYTIKHQSKIGDLITAADICVKGYEDLDYKKVAFTKKELASEEYLNSIEYTNGDKFRYSNAYKEYLAHSQDCGGVFDFGSQDFTLEQNKFEVKWPSSLDGISYVLNMNHNLELHISAMQEACYWQDQPKSIASERIPHDLLEFKDICQEIFTSESPIDVIDRNEVLLRNITGMNADSNTYIDLERI